MTDTRRSPYDIPPQLAHDLIQSIPEGIVVVDDAGRVTFFNHGAEQITGWKAKNTINEPVDRILSLKGGESILERITSRSSLPPVDIFRHDGQEITLAVSRTDFDLQGETGWWTVLVLRDVTKSDAVQRLRSYFLSNISHEFRTPLSALKASVELLLEDFDDLSPAETASLLNSVHFSVTGLQTLIDNLLESTSIEAGRFEIRRRPTNLETLMAETARVMKPLLDRRNQKLQIDLPENLPRINVDPMRLSQVLVNLLSNASKYGPMDQPIDVNITLVDNGIKVTVEDRGEGIPIGDRENIFLRYIRLDNKDQAQYGIGLGLAVVKTIVEQHGGLVGYDERPGGGSIFWFTMPLEVVPS
jgi:PAS domain S-box-containing protein